MAKPATTTAAFTIIILCMCLLLAGKGKTKTGRQWVYLRDERPHAGSAPPAVLYRYTPDRKGERCREHLKSFSGYLHADGYAGFEELYTWPRRLPSGEPAAEAGGRIMEVACWAHVRRKFYDVHKANGSPIAKEALEKIGAPFGIERTIAGKPPHRRCEVRQLQAKPKLDALAAWLDAQLKLIPSKCELAGAIRYARSRWEALTRYADDGRLEISNNAAENAIRPVALGRKNWLFAGGQGHSKNAPWLPANPGRPKSRTGGNHIGDTRRAQHTAARPDHRRLQGQIRD